jgi:hypothetical protein
MASAAADRDERGISIGNIFSRAFATIVGNPVATLGIAFLFGALPSQTLAFAGRTAAAQSVAALGRAGVIGFEIFSAVMAVVLAMLTQGALVRATTAYSEGLKASFGESAMAGLAAAPPLFLLGLLSALGIGLGFVLLLVPGVILYIMWSVAAPALVEERLGPIQALGRSRDLTRGARWKILGLTLVVLACCGLLYALIGILAILWYGGIQFEPDPAGANSLNDLLVGIALGTFISAVWGVIQASLYVELRDWKDGPRSEALAEIFG